ncbi:MAG: polysaccharide pyruvyl transferase family protein [Muribaculaceae bacterium]|nr:polysaccharide pyruvyl transferase family protein [Muribaculaceae bacterium]
MKYGLLTYTDTPTGTNIGDYIQSLAARQYLPQVDQLLNRERLDDYDDDEVKLIMNGWFTHTPSHWIPAKNIHPHFVAFHINHSVQSRMLTQEGITYLKTHGPIGCRDLFTTELLQSKGVPAFYSGCLTLTLDLKYKVADKERGDDIYIVDPIFNIEEGETLLKSPRSFLSALLRGKFIDLFRKKRLINRIIPKEIRKKAIYTHHQLPPNDIPDSERFRIAEDLLHRYAKAKLVITSRIHCALPCLALGTPVIFIDSFSDSSNKSRLKGLTDLFNRIEVNLKTGEIHYMYKNDSTPVSGHKIYPNPSAYLRLADSLKESCKKFIAG